jgi:hypothetical protein
MNHPLLSRLRAASAVAAATLFLIACGGGSGEAPPPAASGGTVDTSAPVVTITDNVSATSATGDVTFTFTFNKDVGTSFTADDITVTGGTKGAFTRTSGTMATLVVTPTPNSTGTIEVSLAANAVQDARGTGNAVTTSQQAYETAVRTQMSLPVSFDAVGVAYGVVGFGGNAPSIVADPTDAANKVARVVRGAGSETWAGTTITEVRANVELGFAARIPFNATDTRMSVRVWSPDAGIPVRLKVEDSTDPAKSVEAEATVTVAAGWQTLTFNFATQATGTAPLNLSFNYNKASIFFDFGRAQSAAVEKTYYFDDVTFVTGSAGGGGGGGGGSCGTVDPTCAPTTTIPAGSTIIYSDATVVSGIDTFPNWGQNPPVVGTEATIAGNKSLKYVFGTGTAGLYQGIDWNASPQNVTSKTTLHLDMFSSAITSVKVSIISTGGLENFVTRTLTPGSWNAIDIDLALYTVPNKAAIIQIKLEPNVPGTLYVDNIYFHGSAGGGGGGSCGTTAPTCAPTTSVPSGSTVIYTDASVITGLNTFPNWGQNPPVVGTEETIAGNKSIKYVFGTGPAGLYQGIDWSASTTNVTTKATLHLDIWSANVANVKISLIGAGENPITRTLTAGTWTSIDIPLSQYTSVNLAVANQIKIEPNVAGTIYVDNIYFHGTASSGGGGGSGTFTGGIFASDYLGNLGANTARSAEGGSVGFVLDPRLFNNKEYDAGDVSGLANNPGGVPNVYYGIGKKLPAPTGADPWFAAFVNAPGNTTADASAYSKIRLKFWGDAESWQQPNFTAQVGVVLQGPINPACTNPSQRPELLRNVTAQKIGAGSEYVINKADFTLIANCGGAYTRDSVWAAVGAVVVQLVGVSNFNYVNGTGSPVSYPTFINVGPIAFIN